MVHDVMWLTVLALAPDTSSTVARVPSSILELRFIAALLWLWRAARRGGRAIIVIVEAPASIPHLGAALSPRRRGPDAGPAGAAAPAAGPPRPRGPRAPGGHRRAAGAAR